MATTELLDKPQVDVRKLIGAGRYVALVGRFASMSRAQAAEVIAACAHCSSHVRRGTSLVVVGQRDWLLNGDGMIPEALRHLRVLAARENAKTPVVSEEQFLKEMGLGEHAEQVHPEYTTTTLTDSPVLNSGSIRASRSVHRSRRASRR